MSKDNNQDEKLADDKLKDYGQVVLENGRNKIHLLSIIGEIEGHEILSNTTKTTKYEHILPMLVAIEESNDIDGVLIIENSQGGSVESGLAIAEMIASLSKPTVTLVIGDGHSIGVPIAVAAQYTFIVPSGSMIIHPVRSTGMFIGVIQSYRNMEKVQDRIIKFISDHSKMSTERIEQLMLDTTQLVKDVGTILDGEDAVREGLIDEVGGIREALFKLNQLIDENKQQ